MDGIDRPTERRADQVETSEIVDRVVCVVRAIPGAELSAVVLGLCFKSGRGSPALCREVEAAAREKLATPVQGERVEVALNRITRRAQSSGRTNSKGVPMTLRNEWAGSLFDTPSQADVACVHDWLTNNGSTSRECVLRDCSGRSARELAAEMIDSGWTAINGHEEDDEPTQRLTHAEAERIIAAYLGEEN